MEKKYQKKEDSEKEINKKINARSQIDLNDLNKGILCDKHC